MRTPRVDSRTGASLLVYLVLLAFALFEQVGRTTSDTKTPLIERPGTFLHEATTLWDPMMNFGELQNQAYGYLFPQGPFYLAGSAMHVAPWITERVWAVLLVVVAAEGLRRLALSMGFTPWAAWVAGMAYGLSPRILSQFAVRSAELLPTAVLPWVVLPIVLAATGRLAPRRAALFSGVAFMFGGAVNATATVAGLPLVVVFLVWAARRRLVPWSMLGWWSLVLVVTNAWWAVSLLRLRVYSPPFFDFVEDAKTTTGTAGFAATVRGLSNWINYTFMGSRPDWPAGFEFSYQPVLVLASGVLAALGVLGLVWLPKPWRAPVVVAACVGLVCVTVAHSSPFQSPLAPGLQHVLDGGLALLRNVSKAELMVRLPLCLGIGATFARLARRRRTRRAGARLPVAAVAAGALVALVLGMAQPVVALNTRSPGWTQVPDYWSQAAAYLDKTPGHQRAWIVPGTGFALQTWGWTFDEPFQGVAKTPWVSRSQVPLAPPTTIRILSSLEHFLETGSGSPDLGQALGRLGLGYVVVRHDLDEDAADTTTSNLVSIALARSRGVHRVALFGNQGLGPAIEVYKVTSGNVAPDLEVRPLDGAVTVGSASSDVVQAVAEGLVSSRQPVVVQGDDGWRRPVDIVGDTYRDREHDFGRVHDSDGPVRAAGEPEHGGRVVQDYPANEASRPVRAEYDGATVATASSSSAWVGGLGRVQPESAPYAAFDGDRYTGWRSGYFRDARQQWLEMRWSTAHQVGKVQISSTAGDPGTAEVTHWRITVGHRTVRATVDPFTGIARADLGNASGRSMRIAVDGVRRGEDQPVSILEVASDVTPYRRTLVMPTLDLAADPSFVFTAQPETRACISTLLGPDCAGSRQAASEESSGIDRTFRVGHPGSWSFSGTSVARSTPGTVSLLDPIGSTAVLHASSQWYSDPGVSARLAYDGATTTSWIADPRDPAPRLSIDFDRPRTIDRLTVAAPAPPAVRPTDAVIESAQGRRVVHLDAFGTFAPLRTKHAVITFTNPTRGGDPIGISELNTFPAKITAPLDGGTATGAVCGLGPVLFVDGRRYETKVSGFMGDVVSAGPLHFESCSGPVRLAAGTHRLQLVSTEQFQPVTALLRAPTTSPDGASRNLGRASGPITSQAMTLGPGGSAMLSTTRNLNLGWEATLNGKRLKPMISDGWAQAWRLPAGKGGRLVVTFAPQRPYLVGLYAGLVLAFLALVAAAVLLVRTRLRPPAPIPDLVQPARSRGRWLATAAVGLVGCWVLGGLPVVVGAALGMVSVLVGRRGVARALGFAGMVVAFAVQAWLLRDGPRLQFDAVDLVVGICVALMIATLLPGPEGASATRGGTRIPETS